MYIQQNQNFMFCLCPLYPGAQLGIFWKVAQILQKCRPPWLADEKDFGMRNS